MTVDELVNSLEVGAETYLNAHSLGITDEDVLDVTLRRIINDGRGDTFEVVKGTAHYVKTPRGERCDAVRVERTK